MESLTVGYKTGSDNVMEMTVHTNVLARANIPVLEDLYDACQGGVGCKGKNGGCPPYAPMFGNIKHSMSHFCVITVEYDMCWPIKYGGWRRAGVTTPALYISAYANKITESYIRRILKGMEKQGYYTLGASNCPGCSPKKCTVLKGEKCIKPAKRRYSMEATGVNCCDLHWDLFDNAMPWLYGNTSEYIHTKMWRYAGFFCDGEQQVVKHQQIEQIIKNDWSIWPMTTRDGIRPRLEVYDDVHPEDSYDEGSDLEVYRIPLEEQEDAI